MGKISASIQLALETFKDEVLFCKQENAVRFCTGAPYINTFGLKPHSDRGSEAPRLASVFIYGNETLTMKSGLLSRENPV